MAKKLKLIIVLASIILALTTITIIVFFALDSSKIADNWVAAENAVKAQNYTEAEKLLTHIIQLDSTNEKAYRKLAEIHEVQHQYLTALAYWSFAAQLNPLDEKLRLKQIAMLSKLGEYAAVLTFLNTDAEKNELSPEEKLYYVEAECNTGTIENAQKALDSLSATDRRKPFFMCAEAILNSRNNKIEQAKNTLENLLNSTLEPALKWRVLTALADICILENHQEQALTYFKQAQQLEPERSVIMLPHFFISIGDLPAAENELKTAYEQNPKNIQVIILYAEVLTARRDYPQIQKIIDNFSPCNKRDAETQNYLNAMIFTHNMQYQQALDSMQAAAIYALRPLYAFMQLQCNFALKNTAAMRNDVYRLLAIKDNLTSRTQLTGILMPLLRFYVKNQQPDNAIEIASMLHQIATPDSPENIAALQTLAPAAFRKGKYEEAKTYAFNLLQLTPDDQNAVKIMAESLLALMNYSLALVYFEQLPPEQETFLNMAEAYNALHEFDKTAKFLAEAWHMKVGDLLCYEKYTAFLLQQKKYDSLKTITAQLADNAESRYYGNFMLAQMAEAQDNMAEMKKYYQICLTALAQLPPGDDVKYQQAYILAVLNHDSEAEAIYDDLLRNNPDWDMVLVNLSEVKAALNKPDEAFKLAEKAQMLYPRWEQAAECYQRRLTERSQKEQL